MVLIEFIQDASNLLTRQSQARVKQKPNRYKYPFFIFFLLSQKRLVNLVATKANSLLTTR